MRALALVLPALLVAGCGSGGPAMGDFFPDADDLPAGWSYGYGPEDQDPSEFADGEFAEHAEALRVAGVDGGKDDHTGSIVVIRFSGGDRAEAVAGAARCDEDDLYHILRDGSHVVFVGVDRDGPAAARAAMDQVTSTIEEDTGAHRVC